MQENEKAFLKELKQKGVHILDWLKENNRNPEISIVLTKHIATTLLGDFLNFIYEAFNCARKGKMTVAYALLRKPFNDELLIFEQLLIDREEFIDRFFHQGTPSKYDPSSLDLNKKREIIKSACEKIKTKFSLTPDLVYQLRYDKSCEAGINGISNESLHIVTKDKNYSTPNQDLNLIFDYETIEDYFEYFYYFVPLLLIHSAAIIDELIFSLMPDSEANLNLKSVKIFKRIIALIFLMDEDEIINGNKDKNTFASIPDAIVCKCENCGNQNAMSKADFKLFLEVENFICTKCFTPLLSSTKTLEPIFEFLKVVSKSV
jgi:hypothetical protein